MGISFEGFELEFMAFSEPLKRPVTRTILLLVPNCTIEKIELKRLSCSINYDSKGSSYSHGKNKGRAMIGYYEA